MLDAVASFDSTSSDAEYNNHAVLSEVVMNAYDIANWEAIERFKTVWNGVEAQGTRADYYIRSLDSIVRISDLNILRGARDIY